MQLLRAKCLYLYESKVQYYELYFILTLLIFQILAKNC